MNRKGFTLIELIITIALLAVLALISFVTITKVIEKSKKDNCQSLVQNIKTGAAEYVSDYRYSTTRTNCPGSATRKTFAQCADANGGIAVITAKDLIAGNYLQGPIVNPFTSSELTDGSGGTPDELSAIKITLTLNKDFSLANAVISVDGGGISTTNIDFITDCQNP